MSFNLAFFLGRTLFSAVVAKDGNVYFHGADVGRFLGYCNPYQFAANHAKVKLTSEQLLFNRKGGPYIPYEDLLTVIKKATESGKFLNDYNSFLELYTSGMVEDVCSVPEFDCEKTPTLTVKKEGSIKLHDWIKKFVGLCLEKHADLEMHEDLNLPDTTEFDPTLNNREEPLNLTTKEETIPDEMDIEDEPLIVTCKKETPQDDIADPILHIACEGMRVPHEVCININGQLYTYVKAFTHLSETG